MKTTRLILLGVSFVLGTGASAFAHPTAATEVQGSRTLGFVESSGTENFTTVGYRGRGHIRHHRGFRGGHGRHHLGSHHRHKHFNRHRGFSSHRHRHHRPYVGGYSSYRYYRPYKPYGHFYGGLHQGIYSYQSPRYYSRHRSYPYYYEDRSHRRGHVHDSHCPPSHFH